MRTSRRPLIVMPGFWLAMVLSSEGVPAAACRANNRRVEFIRQQS